MLMLGVDAGGTKTEFLLADETGTTRANFNARECNFHTQGAQGILAMFREAAGRLRCEAGTELLQLAGVAVGMPAVEESARVHADMLAGLREVFPENVRLYGDAFTCRYGSLGGGVGINVIAGTGAVCSGSDGSAYARCAGWSASLADEGSCHWVARKTFEVFVKQADGRLEKTPLYEILRARFPGKEDARIAGLFNTELYQDRRKMAQIQKVTDEAYQQGDPHAARIYQTAAEELALMVVTVRGRLRIEGDVPVSYSGGLFRAEHMPQLLHRALPAQGYHFAAPRFTPVQGALLLAAEGLLHGEQREAFLSGLDKTRREQVKPCTK